jgi:ureidoglycolate lyase
MTRIVEIPIEPLTPESFRPFGQLLGPSAEPPVWRRPGLDSWRMGFAIDGTIDVKVSRFLHKELAFEMLERHLTYTESRVPLGGAQAVFVAAPSKDLGDPREIPDPASLRAFFLDGSQGLLAWKGTWHALDTFPARPPDACFVILTEKETQKEIESSPDAFTTKRTHVADYRPLGISFRITDPNGFLARR